MKRGLKKVLNVHREWQKSWQTKAGLMPPSYSLSYCLMETIMPHLLSYPKRLSLCWSRKRSWIGAPCYMHFEGKVFVINNKALESNFCKTLVFFRKGTLYTTLNSFVPISMGNIKHLSRINSAWKLREMDYKSQCHEVIAELSSPASA